MLSKSICILRRRLASASVAAGVASFALIGAPPVSCSAGGKTAVPEGSDSFRAAFDVRIPRVVEDGDAPSVQVAVAYKGRVMWSRAVGTVAVIQDGLLAILISGDERQ